MPCRRYIFRYLAWLIHCSVHHAGLDVGWNAGNDYYHIIATPSIDYNLRAYDLSDCHDLSFISDFDIYTSVDWTAKLWRNREEEKNRIHSRRRYDFAQGAYYVYYGVFLVGRTMPWDAGRNYCRWGRPNDAYYRTFHFLRSYKRSPGRKTEKYEVGKLRYLNLNSHFPHRSWLQCHTRVHVFRRLD